MAQYIAYYRVSTARQGASGLGLEAQRKMCVDFARSKGGEIVKEFTDIESGKSRSRQALWDAIDYAKANEVGLIIAKLDRLARDVEFTFKVMNLGIEIHFTDMPVVNTMILGVFASVAQYERELISARTKAAFAAKAARGETWIRNTDNSVAVAASAKARTDARLEWVFESVVGKYIQQRWQQGWSFTEIWNDLQRLYAISPDVYCSRTGGSVSKGTLSKMITMYKDMYGAVAMSERDRRNGGR